MDLLKQSIANSLARGTLIAPAQGLEVFWTPSVEAKLKAARTQRGRFVELGHPDMIVGSYRALRTLRDRLRADHPRLWLGTDIHHIVENQHLQFVGRRGRVDEHSYVHEEPCVLLPQDSHRLLMDSLIGGSVTLHRERRVERADQGIDYLREYEEYRRHHPVPSTGPRVTRTDKAHHRADWVSGQKPGTRRRLGEMLLEIYDFAYHQSDERPLRLIAADTIRTLTTS